MRISVLIAWLLLTGCALAQSASSPVPRSAAELAKLAPAAKPADVDTIDHIVSATYDVISGPAGGKRDWDRFRSLFLPEGRLTAAGKREKSKAAFVEAMSVEDYVKGAGDYFAKQPFYEDALVTKTQRYGAIAQAFSSYESHRVPGDKAFERGINSFELAWDGQRWWIVSISWDSERDDNPLPADFAKP